MSFRDALQQAVRLLLAQKLRSALTLFGLVWGTAAVIFLMSWGRGVHNMLESAFLRVGKNLVQAFNGRVSEEFTPATGRRFLYYTMEDVEALRERARLLELVSGEARKYLPAAFGPRSESMEVRGVEPAGIAIRSVALAAGRNVSEADVEHRRRVLVLGDTARRRLLGTEGRLGSWVRIDGTPFEVVGVLARVGTQLSRDGDPIDEQLWVPITTHQGLWPNEYVEDDVVNTLIARVADRRRIAEAKLEMRGILAERLRVPAHDEEAIPLFSPIEMLERMPTEQQDGVNLLIALTTLVIGGVGVLSLMLDAVRQRRSEIGVRLAVGARRRDIVVQFFLETFSIVALGGALGVALGVAGALFLGSDALRSALPPDLRDLVPEPELVPSILAIAFGAMVAVGVLAGVVPAWRAARIDPAETLRTE
jgi:putative ABC transport system permease protein